MASPDLSRFADVVGRKLGLALSGPDLARAEHVLLERARALAQPPSVYVAILEGSPPASELGALAQALTVRETYFFRHADQLHALRDVVLPEIASRAPPGGVLRILSAGCASGEEAYSLAIVAGAAPGPWSKIDILGVDIVAAALERARSGRYSSWSLREIPAAERDRWFRSEGSEFLLSPEVLQSVRFQHRNLTADNPDLWAGGFDVIFCRNVLMYLRPEAARALVERFARALERGGYLFLGHAETLRGISTAFHLCHDDGAFYYQQQGEPRALHATPIDAPPPVAAADDSWAERITLASARVRTLTDAHQPTPDSAAPEHHAIDRARELLRDERFAEALAVLPTASAGRGADPDLLILRAVLLAHHGDMTLAEETCRELLSIDNLHAGARYVLALCRESRGETDRAADADREAIHLDPTFAMPRLHLGLMARRSGDSATARMQLEQAVTLLAGEEPGRLLLFGGGFGRTALISLCRAELRALAEAR